MKWSTLTAVLLVLLAMVWLAGRGDEWRNWYGDEQTDDYYNLLVAGLREGHLYVKADVDPGLLSPDPKIRAQASYRLDMSLYHGRYYLYFGIVPVVLTYLPYALLTGHYLPPNAAVLLMVGVGFLFYVWLFADAKRRYSAALPPLLEILCVLALAFAPGTSALLVCAGVYEAAVAGGYLCLAVACWSLFRALHAESGVARWLALASFALGLAVGCRPTYVVALPAVLLAAAYRARTIGSAEAESGGRGAVWLRRLAAAVVPAGGVGVLLMAYNYARFRSPFEFGLHYQVSQLIATGLPLAKASFVWPNLRWYYFTPPVIGPYFPYVFPINAAGRPADYYGYEPVHGEWLTLMLLLVCGAGLVWGCCWGRRPPRGLLAFLGLLGVVFVALLLCLASFGFRADRYVVDFQASLVLGLVLMGAWSAVHAWSAKGLSRIWLGLFCLLAAMASLFGLLSSIELQDHVANTRRKTFTTMAHFGNYPAYLFARWGWLHYGPIRFTATFVPQKKIVVEPLLATGTPGHADVLYATQYPGGLIGFSIAHQEIGSLKADPVKVSLGQEHDVEVDMGSLYPPRWHPFFRGWKPADVEKLKTTARVLLDGQEILQGRFNFYDAPPTWVSFGRNPAGSDRPFSGRIHAVQRLPPRDPGTLELFTEAGAWRFQIEFPFNVPRLGQPLIASGVAGQGNLLLLEILDGQTIRFGFDQWGAGIAYSPALEITDSGPHRLEVFIGAQVVRQQFPAAWRIDPGDLQASASLLRVWLDGRPVWTTPILVNADSYDLVSVGTNPQGFSTAAAFFSGTLKRVALAPEELHRFLEENFREPRRPPP
jgi:hypothetical protein